MVPNFWPFPHKRPLRASEVDFWANLVFEYQGSPNRSKSSLESGDLIKALGRGQQIFLTEERNVPRNGTEREIDRFVSFCHDRVPFNLLCIVPIFADDLFRGSACSVNRALSSAPAPVALRLWDRSKTGKKKSSGLYGN